MFPFTSYTSNMEHANGEPNSYVMTLIEERSLREVTKARGCPILLLTDTILCPIQHDNAHSEVDVP